MRATRVGAVLGLVGVVSITSGCSTKDAGKNADASEAASGMATATSMGADGSGMPQTENGGQSGASGAQNSSDNLEPEDSGSQDPTNGGMGAMSSLESGGSGGDLSQNVGGSMMDQGGMNAGGSGGQGGLAGGASGGSGGSAGSEASSSDAGTTAQDYPDNALVYVGGYDYGSDSYPLSLYSLDVTTGTMSLRDDFDAGANPSYLALAPSENVLYVANELDDNRGGLTAMSISADGSLTRLNHQVGSDGGYAYVGVSPDGKFAIGASYNGGSISVFPIMDDGSLGPETANRDFGQGAQSHCVAFGPDASYVLVPNKGNDEVAQLLLATDGSLSDNSPPAVAETPGAGPRHIALNHEATLAFVINELGSTMTPYQLSAAGTLTPGTTVSTRQDGKSGQNTGAHVEMTPDERLVIGSNRGDNDLVVFTPDPQTGELTLVEHEPSRGSTPRDFDVDVSGRVVVVANQDSTNLAVFSIEEAGLEPLGDTINGPPAPVAVQILYKP